MVNNEVGGEEASKGKDSPFYVSTVWGEGGETAAEEESKVESESGIEEMTLADNAKDFPVSEGFNKRPTILWDIVTDDKYSIETRVGTNISLEESLFNKGNVEMSIKEMVENCRLAIEAEQEGEDWERDEEEGE